MSDAQPPAEPGFQRQVEAMEGFHSGRDIPAPVNPLQAQTAFERRARAEDYVAHIIAIIQSSGFFMLALLALLGFVDLSNAAVATFLGTVMGYAIAKLDPVMTRYFLHGRAAPPPVPAQQQQSAPSAS